MVLTSTLAPAPALTLTLSLTLTTNPSPSPTPKQVAALWQLGMQQLVASRDAESALRQEARTKQRAFVAGLRNFGWPAV